MLLQPTITNKQLAILKLLYKFRFLTRPQIQTLLNHKQFNRIIAWLNELTEKEYVGRIYTPKIGDQAKPAIYYLKTKSRQLLRKQADVNPALLERIYREEKRSDGFKEHCIFVADTYLSLLVLAESNKAKLHFSTKTELTGMKYLILPPPDAYFALEESNGTIKRYFLEVFDAGIPRFVQRKRLERYVSYYDDRYWQNNTNHPFPEVMIVCPDQTTKNSLHKFMVNKLEDDIEHISFYLTTKDQIKLRGIKKEIWEKVA